ncbi:site-specific DNA-methyltransferase [Pseudooceanicola sp. CBS1P-1]|uniref:site-specific DNA-methyltransferase (adenine-specific) n=1 Tax=Pseudooceanicola albus TaxID=2692189 RepID=A0A6L7GA21_9RHOB|nr:MULTISPECIES: site-specific DNA-methyltransferase [Pseudooceanicola]MBT9386329.1 site-specific DNA-methyltransferase [Pseudooceanicola endophyticus]MXN20378.1 site-specific DNA-methyltransferase [Pseudooceanicola albus]
MPLLNWLTRDEDLRSADRVPYRLLDEVPELSQGEGDQGLLVQGDNLEALKALLPFYAGRVKCIYIDPPYNTRSAFEHYDDSLEHAKWLAMIVPRLMLLREFLSEDGSIWVSIDDNEGHYLKVVMDEIFGRRNFVDTVIWEKADSPRNSARQFSSDHDYIFVYAKNEAWVPKRLPRSAEKNAIYKNPDDDPRGPWLPGDPYANKPYSKGQYVVTGPTGREFQPPVGRFWRISQEKLQDLDKDGRIWWGPTKNARPSIKRYLTEVSDLVPRTLWKKDEVGSNRTSKNELRNLSPGEENFTTPKPEPLIQRILHIATNPGDLVLDSFLGSGTTAAVAHKMGRRWIGIEMGEHARTHCALRLKKVIAGEDGGISNDVGWTGGGGFRFCRLGPAVYDAEGRIDAAIRFADLARHVWFSETRRPLGDVPDSPLLGKYEGRAVALLYNGILKDRSPHGGNVLTRPVLRLLKDALPEGFGGELVVYGTACRLSADTLKQENILFRQTPYDIAART